MIIDYPEEIKKAMEIYEPYRLNIKDGELKDAPQEAIDAFYKCKKWAWEQEQQMSNHQSRDWWYFYTQVAPVQQEGERLMAADEEEYKDFVEVTGYGVDPLGLCGINCQFERFVNSEEYQIGTTD